MYIPETKTFRDTPVYDGHKMHFGNRVSGPAMIEQVTTAIFVSDAYDCAVDALGSFVIWQKDREDLAAACFENKQEVTA
jgi:N-methylhydantoinase A